MLTKADILQLAVDFTANSPANVLPEEKGLVPGLGGLRYYEEPIMACADASDPLFKKLQEPGIVGPHFGLPEFWLPGAKSVLAFFFPFTDRVIQSNSADWLWPSREWVHARIEGQTMMMQFGAKLQQVLEENGHAVNIPIKDKRFGSRGWTWAESPQGKNIPPFSSNWSERHAAFVAGLGTFALSKGMITEKGIAGRFFTLITDLPLEADPRPYTEYDEYCSKCGACIKHCPVNAISLEHGKDHATCTPFLERTLGQSKPHYGCGKCQVAVPCTRKIPPKRKNAN